LATAAGAWLVAPQRARAERAIMFPHGGDANLQALRIAAHEAVLAALDEQDVDVRTANVQAAVSGGAAGCAQISCAPALLAAAPAELAVAVAVWRSDSGPQVNVTLVDAQGNRYPAVSAVEPGGAPVAARRALLDARGLQLLGPGPWVQIEGAPDGASVIIDGVRVGSLPYRAALSSGDHVLELQAPGYAAQQRELQMPLDPTATLRLQVALAAGLASPGSAAEPAGSRAPGGAELAYTAPDAPSDAASPWNYVIGGVAIAAGVAVATIDPVRAAARDGECVDRECERVYAFGADSALKLMAGVALAGAGAAVLIWRPLRVRARVDGESAGLDVHAQF
jgi:hypothetical protein